MRRCWRQSTPQRPADLLTSLSCLNPDQSAQVSRAPQQGVLRDLLVLEHALCQRFRSTFEFHGVVVTSSLASLGKSPASELLPLPLTGRDAQMAAWLGPRPC